MVFDGCVIGFVVEVAYHNDVGLRIGSEKSVDALPENVSGLVAIGLFVEARGPVVHENVKVVAIALELILDDVTGVVRIDVMELGRVVREYILGVNDRAIDAAISGRFFVENLDISA